MVLAITGAMLILQHVLTVTLIFVSSTSCLPLSTNDGSFNLSIVHVNDFHARYEETRNDGNPCTVDDVCIGGFSRLYKQIRTILDKEPKSLLLNAGDNYQGTIYFIVGKWNITQEFLNKLPFDAGVLGNHEFDKLIEGLVPFLDSLNFPIVVSNIDDSLEPTIQGKYNKSTVIERDGKKIGIIGVIYSTVNDSEHTGNLKFLPESASVNLEAERLVREERVFTNIVLSHCGYELDQAIAANATESIGLIVGGHSHSFLYTGNNPPGPDKVQGPYPTIITSSVSGRKVLITQAAAYSRYLGNITVFYGANGEVLNYSGAPIYLDNSYRRDEEIDKALIPWTKTVEKLGNKVVGTTLVELEGDENVCRARECTLGNFVTDAMVFEYTNNSENSSWTKAAIAFTNLVGIMTGIKAGNITYNQLITAQPFQNTIDLVELKGKHIKEMLEYSTTPAWPTWQAQNYLKLVQSSGIQVVLNISRPEGERVQSVKVRCQQCQIPVYEDLDLEETYKVILPSFLRQGGDGFSFLKEYAQNPQIGRLDTDVFVDYLKAKSPIFEEIEGRIIIYGQERQLSKRNIY